MIVSVLVHVSLVSTFCALFWTQHSETVRLQSDWPDCVYTLLCEVVSCPRRNTSERVWYWAFHYKVQSVDWEGGNHRVLFYLNREWHSFARFFPLQLHVNIHLYILHRVLSLFNLLNTWWYHTITSASISNNQLWHINSQLQEKRSQLCSLKKVTIE